MAWIAVVLLCWPPDANAIGQFLHGVASGDPLTDRVIIWTRVTADVEGPIDVDWFLAEDPALLRRAAGGRTVATAAADYTVKIDVTGLTAGKTYYYQFRNGQDRSPIGRTRTLPVGKVAGVRLAVVSCSNYAEGYFNAYRLIAARTDIDAVLHLGDYIYEYHQGGYGNHPDRILEPSHEIISIGDYRQRYALYRSDPDLQALHRAHPIISVWDDHEFANDAWTGGAQNHNNQDSQEGDWATRKAVARQAYFEWLPIRQVDPKHPDRIYRSFDFGGLARIIMLDTRIAGRDRPLMWEDFETGDAAAPVDMKQFYSRHSDPTRSILGKIQLGWLRDELAESKARGQIWRIIGQQVIFASLDIPDTAGIPPLEEMTTLHYVSQYSKQSGKRVPFGLDAWDGYPHSQRKVARILEDAGAGVVVLTGDTHMRAVVSSRVELNLMNVSFC